MGAENVALLDAGDIMQGTLLSNLFQGESTIDIYNTMGYQAATFGNHEFDWGKQTLIDRTQQASFPFVTANIVVNDTGDCATAGWTTPDFAVALDHADGRRGGQRGEAGHHRRDHAGDPDHHHRVGYRRPLLQGCGQFDHPLLR